MNPVPADSRHRDWVRRARLQVEAAETRAESTATRGSPRNSLSATSALPADFLPGYVLEREIGRGGQGVVCLGVQKSTGQRVAVKVLRDSAFGGPLERGRFEQEVQILAALRHPNIVTIHDCGTVGTNPYLVMDYIEGQPLDKYVQSVDESKHRKARGHELLHLFATICEAVNVAHLRGVIHRDLKPSNIRVDACGAPHILDFGLAKRTTAGGGSGPPALPASPAPSPLTVPGHFVGSLPWAAPEQVDADVNEVDTRTDVYALGVILYQLLTHRFPYPVVGRMRVVMDHIRESPPANPRARNREIDDELATVVLKCLAKERERRYQTAGELARDLRRYLADEPIEAKRDSGWYVLRKTMRRYRRGVMIGAAFVVLATTASIALSILYARQGRLLVEVGQQRDLAEYESYVANLAAANAAIAANDGGAAMARLQIVPTSLRGWEWDHLVRRADQSVATWHGPKELITGRVRLSPDSRFVAASFWMEERAGVLQVWPRTSAELAAQFVLEGHQGRFEFVAAGQELLLSSQPGCVSRVDFAALGKAHVQPAALRPGETIMGFSPNGVTLLTALPGEHLGYFLQDLGPAKRLRGLRLPPGRWALVSAFDAQGARLALGLNDGTVMLWEVASGQVLAQTRAHAERIHALAFSPDGSVLATTGGEIGAIKLWDLAPRGSPPPAPTGGHPASLLALREIHDGGQRSGEICFSPDGTLLAVPSEGKTVRIWRIADAELRATLLGHNAGVTCAGFSSDRRFLVSGARGGEVKLWDLQQLPAVRIFSDFPNPLNSLAFTADGARLILECASGIGVIDLTSGQRWPDVYLPLAVEPRPILPGPGRGEVTMADTNGSIRVWDLASQSAGRVIGEHKSTPCLAGDSSCTVFASADAEAIVLWDWAKGYELRRLVGPAETVRSLALSHHGAHVAIGLNTGALFICDARTGESRRIQTAQAHVGSVTSVAFSPDGAHLASGSGNGAVQLIDIASDRVIWCAAPHLGDIWCVAFSPDGTRLAAAGRDRTVRIVDTANGRELVALRGPTGTVMCLAFSPDGQRIAAGTWAREVFIWTARETVVEDRSAQCGPSSTANGGRQSPQLGLAPTTTYPPAGGTRAIVHSNGFVAPPE